MLFPFKKLQKIFMIFPEQGDGPFAGVGYAGPASSLAARGEFNEGLFRLTVHGVYEVPCMAIGHLHGLRGLRDGAVLHYPLKEDDASVADEGPLGAIDPDASAKTKTPAATGARSFVTGGLLHGVIYQKE